jgi:hypothetical protein
MLKPRILVCGTMGFVTSLVVLRNTPMLWASSQRKRFERLAQDFTTDSVDDNVCAVIARDATHTVAQLSPKESMTSLSLSAFACSAFA